MKKHRTLRGTIRYTSAKPERLGEERGREYFIITDQADGVRLVHAHCEIDDEPNVIRDVVMALDEQWRPIDCSVRLTVGDRHEGVGLMHFRPTYAECQTVNQRDGRISQRIDTSEPVRWLGSHPICGDALCLRIYDLADGPGKRFFPNLMLTSPDHRGATGPMLFSLGFGLEFVGRDRVTVPAGSFDALHFRYVDTAGQLPAEHPPYDVWCTDDGDYIFLKGGVGGYMQTHYELVELVRDR
ncbi:MAG TPA: hypothetical protein VGE08_15090 [Steroidobacter sp.]|uniref:hypothetical protein n=1 Tax=Steroidobacter sp. TaxID=1978227 RepID=UPI002EDB910C